MKKIDEIRELLTEDLMYKDKILSITKNLEKSIPRYDGGIMKELSKIYHDDEASPLEKKLSCELAIIILQDSLKKGGPFSDNELIIEFDLYDADVKLDMSDCLAAKQKEMEFMLEKWQKNFDEVAEQVDAVNYLSSP